MVDIRRRDGRRNVEGFALCPSNILLLGTKVQLARHLATPVVVHHAGPPLEVGAHLLLAAIAALPGQVLLARGAGLDVPPGVLQHLLGRDAPPRVQGERPHQQVDALVADGAESAEEVLLGALRDGGLDGVDVLGEPADAGPVLLGGGADLLADQAHLVELRGAGQVGHPQDHLGHDGAHAPDVHGAAVVLEDQADVLVLGGEDGEQGDDVGVGELLQVLELTDGVRGEALGVFLLLLDLLDGDELAGVGLGVAEVDDGRQPEKADLEVVMIAGCHLRREQPMVAVSAEKRRT
ncbi:hypothetical protein VSDG_01665 [Cytospora chrysosperma]|uniref:Uncharacterized protein n=1 Tax=Cytospora chrysosperma TaxID=252740 RepID=A0A423WH14_CYTCH|nr:hypothetical protein VSDG_01665 [Valsa sordida]